VNLIKRNEAKLHGREKLFVILNLQCEVTSGWRTRRGLCKKRKAERTHFQTSRIQLRLISGHMDSSPGYLACLSSFKCDDKRFDVQTTFPSGWAIPTGQTFEQASEILAATMPTFTHECHDISQSLSATFESVKLRGN
jgi:hypothetical protein